MSEMETYPIEENPYEALTADLTQRCNMKCSFCYDADQTRPDLSLEYFAEVCRRVKTPTDKKLLWKFLGGEPTLHPQLFDMIEVAHACGHRVFFSSNGMTLKLGSSIVDRLKSLPYSVDCGVTMDGGVGHDDIYQEINGQRCAVKKMAALEALLWTGKPIYVSAIIVRGVNECVVGELLTLAKTHHRIAYVHFRPTAQVGRYLDVKPYSMSELREMVRPFFTEEEMRPQSKFEIWCPSGDPDCCVRFMPRPGLQVSLVEFMTPRAALCPKRGKLIDGFRVAPFFEDAMRSAIEHKIEREQWTSPS